MDINLSIKKLVTYGISCDLINEADRIYTTNLILAKLGLNDYTDVEFNGDIIIEDVLAEILDFAIQSNIIEDSIANRDLFDTDIMNLLMPRPSEVISKFNDLYKTSPKQATDYFYNLSQNSDYIRRYRIKKDKKWITSTKYGDLDITINLSKPEKDPKAIAAALTMKQSSYPKCQLCIENEGYAGTLNHPARQNHRIIPITINSQQWGFQYSPYVYYNEHCIVLNGLHTPMKIDKSAFIKLFDFVKLFPHYFVGSNADLPIVGGSILTHDHFQGGNYSFAMAKAPIEEIFKINDFQDVVVGIVKWPMSVIRLSSENSDRLIALGDKILTAWRNYTDKTVNIFAYTGDTPHNTITPIARKNGDMFELDLVLRNNITTDKYPDGMYHPHKELHNIKKENIGLIEVMGLAVLPARLKNEMKLLKQYILDATDISSNESIAKHSEWVEKFMAKYDHIDENNIDKIIEDEIGLVFETVLEHAGVFKRTREGKDAFVAFLNSLNN